MAQTQRKAVKRRPPEELEGGSLLEWDSLCEQLAAVGKLETAPLGLMVLWCDYWATYRDARRAMRETSFESKNPNGANGMSVACKVCKDYGAAIRRLAHDLGLPEAGSDDDPGDLEI